MAAAVDGARVVMLTQSELDDMLVAAAQRGAQLAIDASRGTVGSQLLTRAQLAEALAVSVPTIDRLTADGMPRASTRPPRFDLAQCRAWLASRDVDNE